MRLLLLPLLLFTLLNLQTLNAQETTAKKEQIAKVLADYFYLERENIHVHFDKKIFLTSEKIWFKGYVFHRKMNMPFFATTNIYASLIDQEGNILETQLLYGSLASFSGSFALGEKIKSGKYYLQFYTNWMNNFTEDESAIYEVDIINPDQGIASDLGRPDLTKINFNFRAEGGTIVKDCVNSIGISISDCNGYPVPATSANIVNENGEVLKTIPLNSMGYGRFDLTGNPAGLKAEVIVHGNTHRSPLPSAELKGIAITVNNYAMPDKVIINLRTNNITKNSLGSKPLYMVIQQDAKAVIADFNFTDGKLEHTLVLPQTDFFSGLNTIRLLDNDLNQIAERIVFKYPAGSLKTEVQKGKRYSNHTELTANVGYPAMNVSVSVLPGETASIVTDNDIYSSFLISPYIEDKNHVAAKYFLESYSKAKHYELDLFLLNQQSKYNWRNIMHNPPKNSHTFDIGVTLKATINQNIKNRKDYKVRVVSLAGMFDEQVDINEKGEIQLENLILADSSMVKFSLIDKSGKTQQIKLYPQIFNNIRQYNKKYKPLPQSCAFNSESAALFADLDLPLLPKNTIMLEAVELTADKKELKFSRAAGHGQLRGYKISETDSKNFFYILDFIRYHGFDVENNGVDVGIYGRTMNTINGQRTSPLIYMDNIIVRDFSVLLNIQTADIDEFYVNQHAMVPSVDNRMGIVRMYMKKTWERPVKGSTDNNFIVKNGYKTIKPFENITYSTTSDEGFQNFGLIDWEPMVLPDGSGEFKLEIPHTAQSRIKLLIEGFSADGKLISEIKTIDLN